IRQPLVHYSCITVSKGRARRSKNYPPPSSSPATRGRKEVGGWNVLNDLNVLNYAPSTERYSFTGIVNNPRQLHQRRTAPAPRRRLLIRIGDAEDCCFVERLTDDLHGERQAHPIKSGADGNRRVAGHVECRGQIWPLKKVGRFLRAYFGCRPVGAKR